MELSRRMKLEKALPLGVLLVTLLLYAAPGSQLASAEQIGAPRIANPAAVFCGQQGGALKSVRRVVAGIDYGAYTACVFGDNRWCEEWAMFRGTCPVGGLKITGYEDEPQIYCAITGGAVDMERKTCSYANGANCDLNRLFAGRCGQQTVPTASGIHYRQYPEAGLAVAYLKGAMTLVESSGGVASAGGAAAQKDKRLKLIVDITSVADLPADGPLGFNRRDAEQERAALDAGSFGPSTLPAVRESGKVIFVGDLNVKIFVSLARFEVCSVLFERVARFYHAGMMVTMTLAADPDRLIADNPGYFTVDAQNCGKSLVWQRSGVGSAAERFYADLIAEKVSRSALNWFYSFQPVIGATVVRESTQQ
jgi:putative hemolysin